MYRHEIKLIVKHFCASIWLITKINLAMFSHANWISVADWNILIISIDVYVDILITSKV